MGVGGGGRSTGGCGVGCQCHTYTLKKLRAMARARGVWCARAERGLAGRCVAALAPGTWRTRGGGRMALRRARFRWPGRVVRVNVWAWGCWIRVAGWRHQGQWVDAQDFLQGPLGSAPVGVRAGKGFKFREKINFGPSVKHFLLFYFFKKIIFFKKY